MNTMRIQRPIAGLLALMLAGCATFSDDGGLGDVSALTNARIGQPLAAPATEAERAARSDTVAALLKKPLNADDAVRIALLSNHSLQASMAGLGIAEADLVQAGRLRNPSFTFGRLRGGEDVEIERSVMFDLIGLLTMPIRSGIEQQRFEQAKLELAADAVRIARDTRRAWIHAVAAKQNAVLMERVKTSADAGAELALRMAKVGNFSALDYQRQQAFYADATAQLARAQQQAVATREQLVRMLGIGNQHGKLDLPDRLPDLPQTPASANGAEALALEQRLDVRMAMRQAEMLASSLNLTRATGFINVLHVGYQNKSETGSERANGYEVELELPLFDWGGARTRRAQSQYMAAVSRTAGAAQRAQSEVRETYGAYRTAFDLARHYRDEIVPLRAKISEEILLRYNGMLVGIFELLSDAREQTASVVAAIDAQRDYWLAETDLQAAINGTGGAPSASMRATPVASPAQGGH